MFMFIGVALGAFGAHALKGKVEPYLLDVFKTGVLYHLIHALGLFAVAWLSTISQDPKIAWAGILLIAGIVLFSGRKIFQNASRNLFPNRLIIINNGD